MGLIENIKSIFKKPNDTHYAEVLNGYSPIYSQFGQNIYASDVVQQAIYAIVTELKKLNPQHIVSTSAGTQTAANSKVQNVLTYPNSIMTTADFIEKIIWSLFLNYNSFILPTYEESVNAAGNVKRTYTGLYPLSPVQVDFLQDESGTVYTKMRFANGQEFTIPYAELIHIRSHFSVNDYMGGNASGQPDNGALLKTLEINDRILKSVSTTAKSSMQVNGVIKVNTLLDEGKTQNELKQFHKMLNNSESGFVVIDNKAEFVPIKKDLKMIDADTIKFVDEKILRHYGVSVNILIGDYTKEQYEAFYQKTLEPIIISLNQAFTKTLFNDNEKARGNKIEFFPSELIFMTVNQKIEIVRLLGDSGTLYENEKLRAFGLPPKPELDGVRMQSLNYVNTEIASKYQVGDEKNE